MIKPSFFDIVVLLLPHPGAQDSCTLDTQFPLPTAGNTVGLIPHDAKITTKSRCETECRVKNQQSSTDRKTHSNFSVSA